MDGHTLVRPVPMAISSWLSGRGDLMVSKGFRSPYLLLFLTVLFWAGNSTVARGFVGQWPPVSLAFFRWLVAFIVIAPFGYRAVWQDRAILLRHWKLIVTLAVLSVSLYNTLLYLGLQSTTVINASVFASAMPLFIILIAWLLYRDQLSIGQLSGVVLSLVGILFISTQGELARVLSLQIHRGDMIILLGSLIWALYSVLLRRCPANLNPYGFLLTTIGIGTVLLVPFYLWEVALGARVAFIPSNMVVLAYVGIFPSVLAYLFWNEAVRQVGAGVAGQFVYLIPLLSAALAMIFLGERIYSYHLYALLFIATGIVLATGKRRRQ